MVGLRMRRSTQQKKKDSLKYGNLKKIQKIQINTIKYVKTQKNYYIKKRETTIKNSFQV